MKVGDYVRTKKRGFQFPQIAKIRSMVKDSGYKNQYLIELDTNLIPDYEFRIYKEDVLKSSPNIIDLIEYDDVLKIMYEEKEYVCKVVNVSGVKGVQLTSTLSVGLGVVGAYIKSIVTREQFESMEYKVGE